MSTIVNPTTPMNEMPIVDGGLDIVGFEDRANRLQGGENSDSIVGGNLADVLSGLAGDDTLEGLGGNDRLFGGDGNDSLLGGIGDDTLDADLGNDSLDGGEGNDRLIAEEGSSSTLTGGAGRDTFQINVASITAAQAGDNGNNSLPQFADFTPGEDRIVINGDRESVELAYNPDTGRVALDGREIAQLPTGLSIDPQDLEYIGPNAAVTPNRDSIVYRFFDTTSGVHFYTASEAERDIVQEDLPNYNFEGASYASVDSLTGSGAESVPVYRFFNTVTGARLYTTNQVERDAIINDLPDFRFEGQAFAAYNTEVEGTIPIYRFFNPTIGAHFFTPSEAERDSIIENLPDYDFEGVAYYAFNAPEDAI
jgi:hypothetical protein